MQKRTIGTPNRCRPPSRVFPALIATLSADISPEQKVDALIALYLDNLARNPFRPGYLISELHHHSERLPLLLSSAIGAVARQRQH